MIQTLLLIMSFLGVSVEDAPGAAQFDYNNNGFVDILDLLKWLGEWGC